MAKRTGNPLHIPDDVAKALLAMPADEMRQALGDYLMGIGGETALGKARPQLLRDPLPETATFRVRVDLKDARPPIWRRLEAASDLSLGDVHLVLQAAMGWSNEHLHGFSAGGDYYSPQAQRLRAVDPSGEVADDDEPDLVDETQVRLDQILQDVGDRLWYEYDFGDGWTHVIKLEAVQPRADDAAPIAKCVGGRRDCPPENCGGIWQYNEMVAELGADDFFLVEEVNEDLMELLGPDEQ